MGELYACSLYSDANLVSYYRLEGNSTDSKGVNNGSDTAVSYSASYGKYGQGITCDGSTTKIDLGSSATLKPTGNHSVSVWAKIPSSAIFERLFSNFQTTDYSDCKGIYVQLYDTGYLQCGANNNNAGYYEVGTTTTCDDNTWKHLCYTYDTTNGIYLYVNGAKENQTRGGSVPASVTQSGNNTLIGALNSNGTLYYPSSGVYIDEVSYFSRTLTATEVSSLYNTYLFQENTTALLKEDGNGLLLES